MQTTQRGWSCQWQFPGEACDLLTMRRRDPWHVTGDTFQFQEEGRLTPCYCYPAAVSILPAEMDTDGDRPYVVFPLPAVSSSPVARSWNLSLRSWCLAWASAVWPLVLVLGRRLAPQQPSQRTVGFKSLSAPSSGSLFRRTVGFTLCLKDVVNSITAVWFYLNDLTDGFLLRVSQTDGSLPYVDMSVAPVDSVGLELNRSFSRHIHRFLARLFLGKVMLLRLTWVGLVLALWWQLWW